jgi:hypothetical protein
VCHLRSSSCAYHSQGRSSSLERCWLELLRERRIHLCLPLSLYLTLLSLAHSIAHCVHANVYTATSRSPKHIGTHTSRLHLLTALPQHIRPHHLHQDTGVWWEAELDIVRDALSAQLRFVREQPCRAYLLHCCIRKQTCVHREQLGRGRVP